MNPWMRLLAIFGVAVAAALFVKVLPPLIVLIAFVGGVAGVDLGLKRRVKSDRAALRSRVAGSAT